MPKARRGRLPARAKILDARGYLGNVKKAELERAVKIGCDFEEMFERHKKKNGI